MEEQQMKRKAEEEESFDVRIAKRARELTKKEAFDTATTKEILDEYYAWCGGCPSLIVKIQPDLAEWMTNSSDFYEDASDLYQTDDALFSPFCPLVIVHGIAKWWSHSSVSYGSYQLQILFYVLDFYLKQKKAEFSKRFEILIRLMEIAEAYLSYSCNEHRDYFSLEEVPNFAGNFLVVMSFENLSTLPRQEFIMAHPSQFDYNGQYGFASLVELSLFPDRASIIHNNAFFYLTEMVRLKVINNYNLAIKCRRNSRSSCTVHIPSKRLMIRETGQVNDPYYLSAPIFIRNK